MKRTETVIALALVAGLLMVGGGAVLFVVTLSPAHTDAAAIPSTPSKAPPARYARAVDEMRGEIRALLVKDNLPGLSVAVAVDGELVWAEGFGFANIEQHAAMTPDTRLRLGAASKPLTAAAVGRLVDDGRIDLDAPVQRYVRGFPDKQWPLTLRQVMGDVGGVHRVGDGGGERLPGLGCERLADAVQNLAGDPLRFQPGTEYRYSISGWVLTSAAIEGAAQEPFAVFMSEKVFKPLGMTRTLPEETEETDLAATYFPRMALQTNLGLQTAPEPDYSCFFGAGAFLSTPTDLVRFGSAMLTPGFLKAETIALFRESLRLTSGAASGYALGWKVDDVTVAGTTTRIMGHRGTPMGGTVSLQAFPDHRLVVALATNVSNADRVPPLVLQIADRFVSQPR